MNHSILLLFFTVPIILMGAAGGQLVEFSYTQEQVFGKYAEASGNSTRGIVFASGSDDYLLIRTFSGKTLVETSPITETDGQDLPRRSVYIMNHEYLQHENPAHSDRPVDHKKPLSSAIQDLLNMKEVSLLEKAAKAVGKKGLNGKNTPATLPFFLFVLRITQDSHYQLNSTIITPRHKRASYMHCADTCPPCPDDECIGLCGKDCHCWSLVCGDCCWHLGCYGHDLCCMSSWLQTKCLFPVKFRCSKHYKC